MIRRLQRKFIGIVVLALGLVIVILLGSINLLKYSNTANRADQMLQYLSENKGRFPDEKKPPGKEKPPGINADTGYKTRFFFVWLDQQGISPQFLRKRLWFTASVWSKTGNWGDIWIIIDTVHFPILNIPAV